ncbi:hypothetical protein E2562_019974 [Oryza meyeriana var. granulata]|uniref:Uncharacterized protein n=1 Tax=Oryza meyeriana var. granulata TaxID=110450 RepID=A0A6G1CH73_9ORYZ|nr:hypothetical protein E2562_019974 [Oryza meyeriana var. granulata]KAF0899489.1 hypothetical protein E2562_019974 [Oryza meyeriana var. granulata]KAF0899490.1 hypothetical protein E2562_019974 [Oryza meyeriana var. granulata]
MSPLADPSTSPLPGAIAHRDPPSSIRSHRRGLGSAIEENEIVTAFPGGTVAATASIYQPTCAAAAWPCGDGVSKSPCGGQGT